MRREIETPATSSSYVPATAIVGRSTALLDLALGLLFPAPCLGCGELLRRRSSFGLCAVCRGRLRPATSRHCPGCGTPICATSVPPGFRCGHCRLRPPAFDRLCWGWLYQPPMDRVIHHLKYHRLEYLGRHLGGALASPVRRAAPQCDVVVPIPLSLRRRMVRGFNQAASIARELARQLGLPLRSCLRRRGVGRKPQSRLPRAARLTNQSRAFRVRGSSVSGLSVLLVDDVLTTGATLDAAASCVRASGALAVVAVVAARTPAPDELWP